MSDGTISLAIPPQPTGMRMLAGKRVLVTAAAGTGIGSSVARRALEEGASVVISDAHERRLGETLATLEPLGTVFAIRCDVTQQADIDALWAFATEKLGGVDVLINNAGLGGTSPR
jgi:3-oxoacyl-[acyl-carrier protein] reductase